MSLEIPGGRGQHRSVIRSAVPTEMSAESRNHEKWEWLQAASFCLEPLESFLRDNWNHSQCGNRVCPPPSQTRIKYETSQQNRREIDTKISLTRIRVHGCTAQRIAYLPFGARQNWHNDNGDTGQRDSRNTVFRDCFLCEVRYRLICDVDGKGEEADPYDPEAHFFISSSPLNVRIDRHSPQQCGTRRNLDETIYSETDKGDAPRNSPCRDSD